jgi:hypothetical protein
VTTDRRTVAGRIVARWRGDLILAAVALVAVAAAGLAILAVCR